MSLNRNNQIVWPRRPNGIRRRASAPKVLSKGKISRPAGWVVRLVVLLVVAIPSLIITSPGYVAFADKLPDPSQVATSVPEDTLIYAADNQTLLADLHPPGYQSYFEPLSEMGTLLPEAVISIEDRNFYDEPGIDPQGIVRASVVDLQSHSTAQGASTITQQLVKLRLVGNETTLDRKMREALLAFEIERRYTKAQILEWYLNSVFFANTAWGTAAGSKVYFHTQTKDLDLAQASMLAGIIRGPTLYNPLVNWTSAKQRQKTVLDAMIRDGKITAADAAKAFAEDLSPPKHMFMPENHVVAPSFVRYVTGLLLSKYGSDITYTGGLRVISTLNPAAEDLARLPLASARGRPWRDAFEVWDAAGRPISDATCPILESCRVDHPTRLDVDRAGRRDEGDCLALDPDLEVALVERRHHMASADQQVDHTGSFANRGRTSDARLFDSSASEI